MSSNNAQTSPPSASASAATATLASTQTSASTAPYLIQVAETIPSVEQCYEYCAADPACGAVASFVGITRDNFQGKRVTKLSYEGYIPMAEKEMYKLCHDAVTQYPTVRRIAAVHVIGDCPVGQASVILVAASPHRKDALQCCDFLINELKARIPIWKLEVYQGDDEQSVWKENIEWHQGKPQRIMKRTTQEGSSSMTTTTIPPIPQNNNNSPPVGAAMMESNAVNSSCAGSRNNAVWALLSGVLGATASCCAKVAFASANDLTTWSSHVSKIVPWFLQQQEKLQGEASGQFSSSTVTRVSCPPLWQFTASTASNSDSTDTLTVTTSNDWMACYWTLSQVLPRFIALVAMILCNAAMVACFVEGLQEAGSIAGTALSTAANFITAALWGYLIWQEDTMSWTGLALVITGTLCLLVGGQQQKQQQHGRRNTTNKIKKEQ